MLSSQTKIGLTFGQIIAVLGVLSSIGYSWMTMNIRVSNLEQNKAKVDENYVRLYQENRQDHEKLAYQMNEIYKLELENAKLK